jgi:allophanate hydrolase subunit 2
VTPRGDRVGLRLSGPRLPRRTGELPVAGMVPGAIQVPPDGQPIVLLANCGPTGGYPVPATVITADLPLAGQARPGARLRFIAVERATAIAALRQRRAELDAATPAPSRRGTSQLREHEGES